MKFLSSLALTSCLAAALLYPPLASGDLIAFEDFDGGDINLSSTANVFDYDAGGGTLGDVFGRVAKWDGGLGTGGPFDVMDDSVVDTSAGGMYALDVLGLSGQNGTAFFAMNDPDAINAGALNNAVWTFDISSAQVITNVTIDIAAAGDFESNSMDGFTIEAQIDGTGYQTIFQGITDEAATKSYRLMDNGNAVVATNDPLELYIDGVATGIYLDKSDPETGLFDTYACSGLNGLNGNSLDIRISWAGTPTGGEPMGFDNFTIEGTLGEVTPEAPTITQDPVSASVGVLSPVSFAGNATGVPVPTYLWYKDGLLVTDGTNITGATSRTLNILKAFSDDQGDYTLVATNASGSATSAVATLTVSGFVMNFQNTRTFTGVPISVPVPFLDNQFPITSVTATSGNQSLLPDGNISAVGSGSDWSLNLSPLPGTNGVAVINVVASDGSYSTNASFGLIVVPSSGVYFNDYFDYSDGPLVVGGSNVWNTHSGVPSEMEVFTSLLFVSQAGSEDTSARLIGAPYTPESGGQLFSRFTLNCLALPEQGNGDYMAHFKDDAFNYRARVFASTNGASAGFFRMGIGNTSGSDGSTAQLPTDLSVGVDYTIVTRLDLATGLCTLWVDPTLESDPSITDTNTLTPLAQTSYAFRQDGGIGEYLIDSLVVGGSFDAVMSGAAIPIPLTIQQSDGNIVLSWDDPSFNLQAAPAATGTYTDVPGASSPYTNSASGDETYFRLILP